MDSAAARQKRTNEEEWRAALPLSTPRATGLACFCEGGFVSCGANNRNQEPGDARDESLEFDRLDVGSVLMRECGPLTLSNTVLPRTAKGRASWLASDILHCRNHVGAKLCVSIE
jgi:hypothetical protein